MKYYWLLMLILPTQLLADDSNSPSPPDDPRQTIAYWKSHEVTASEDNDVKRAHKIFSRLLRAWDNSRVEPGLYVVRSDGGAWAASLADGNILLSLDALDVSFQFGHERGEHLLAFVLAHELAHQRSDDLWHQRFFRSMRNQKEQDRQMMLNGLSLEAGTIHNIEQKEMQADRDGLIMMSSVGFDPWQVLADKDFFSAWVESIWRQNCDSSVATDFSLACQQAMSRALRARSQLATVASQATVYDLGIQAMVAEDYEQARHYFTVFGREYPNRNVMSAIGISYLNEALEMHKKLIEQGDIEQIDFYYPVLLDTSAGEPRQGKTLVQKRGSVSPMSAQLQQEKQSRLNSAAQFLQKAIQIDPDYRLNYLFLAMVHIVENNPYLVRGVLQGRYIPRFGDDASTSILLAMVSAQEGKPAQAVQKLQDFLTQDDAAEREVLPQDVLEYTAVHNLAALYDFLGEQGKIEGLWKGLAQRQKALGNAVLFRLALKNLTQGSKPAITTLSKAPSIKGVRLGDRKPRDDMPHRVSELWIEGEQYHVYIYEDGARYTSAVNGVVMSASQVGGYASLEGLIETGAGADRPLKTLGLPDRVIHLVSGEYLAYDDLQLALHIVDNRVRGWFLYE